MFDTAALAAIVLVLCWAVTATLLAILGVFEGWLAIAASATLWLVVFTQVHAAAQSELGRTRYGGWVVVAAAMFIVSSSVLTLLHPGEHLWTGRDPATYVNTAGWLSRSGGLTVEARVGPYAQADDLSFGVPGFYDLRDDGGLSPQFLHAFPAMMATAGDVAGNRAMFVVNAVLGGVGLLTFFALAARLAAPISALVALMMVGGSQVFLYFTRAPFSEPLALVFLIGGSWAVVLARSARSRHLWFLGGLLLGAGCLARIDGLVALIPVVAFAVIARRLSCPTETDLSALLGGFLASVALAVVDLALISPFYAADQQRQVGATMAAVAAVVLVSWLPRSWWSRAVSAMARHRRGLATGALALLSLALAYAAFLRPEWGQVAGTPRSLTDLQELPGLELEANRTYAELSVRWLSWYLGPIAVAAGFLGLGLLAWWVATGKRQLDVAIWLAITALYTAIYLWRPSITPDQIWAMRRFLPAVVPGLGIGVAVLLKAIADQEKTSFRVASAALGLVILAGVVPRTMDTLGLHELDGLTRDFATACDRFGDSAAVLIIDGRQEVGSWTAQGFRSFCGLPTARTGDHTPSLDRISELASAWSAENRSLFVVSRPGEGLSGVSGKREFSIFEGDYAVLETTFLRRPTQSMAVDLNLISVEVDVGSGE